MCLLCQTANTDCHDCIYFETSKTEQSCCHDEHKETFNAIDTAKTPEARLRAYYDRAQHIREVLEELETKGNLLPEPIEVTIKLSTKEEAQALYAVMSYYHNWELLGEKIANGVCKRLEGFQTEYNQGVIANGVTYENFFKPKLT